MNQYPTSAKQPILSFLFLFITIFNNVLNAQNNYKNYLNAGFGMYSPYHLTSNIKNFTGSFTLETEYGRHFETRLCVDNYSIILNKQIIINGNSISSKVKTTVNYFGIDIGGKLNIGSKFKAYGFVGFAGCFVDEPRFEQSSANAISIDSKSAFKLGSRAATGVKYSFSNTFILFTEFQSLYIIKISNFLNNNINGFCISLGIGSKI